MEKIIEFKNVDYKLQNKKMNLNLFLKILILRLKKVNLFALLALTDAVNLHF